MQSGLHSNQAFLSSQQEGQASRETSWQKSQIHNGKGASNISYIEKFTSTDTLSAIFNCIFSGSLPSHFPDLQTQLSEYATVRLGLYADSSNAVPSVPISADEDDDYLYGRNTNPSSSLFDRQKKWLLSLCWSSREVTIVPVQKGFSYFVEESTQVADYLLALSYEWNSSSQTTNKTDTLRSTNTGIWYKRTDTEVAFRITSHKSHHFSVPNSKWRLGGSGFPCTETDTRGTVTFSVSNPPKFIQKYKECTTALENQLYMVHTWDSDSKLWKFFGAFLAPDDIINLADTPWAKSAEQADRLFFDISKKNLGSGMPSSSISSTPQVSSNFANFSTQHVASSTESFAQYPVAATDSQQSLPVYTPGTFDSYQLYGNQNSSNVGQTTYSNRLDQYSSVSTSLSPSCFPQMDTIRITEKFKKHVDYPDMPHLEPRGLFNQDYFLSSQNNESKTPLNEKFSDNGLSNYGKAGEDDLNTKTGNETSNQSSPSDFGSKYDDQDDGTDDDEMDYYNQYDKELAKGSDGEEEENHMTHTVKEQSNGDLGFSNGKVNKLGSKDHSSNFHKNQNPVSENEDGDSDDDYYNSYRNVETALQGDDGRGATGLSDPNTLAAAMFGSSSRMSLFANTNSSSSGQNEEHKTDEPFNVSKYFGAENISATRNDTQVIGNNKTSKTTPEITKSAESTPRFFADPETYNSSLFHRIVNPNLKYKDPTEQLSNSQAPAFETAEPKTKGKATLLDAKASFNEPKPREIQENAATASTSRVGLKEKSSSANLPKENSDSIFNNDKTTSESSKNGVIQLQKKKKAAVKQNANEDSTNKSQTPTASSFPRDAEASKGSSNVSKEQDTSDSKGFLDSTSSKAELNPFVQTHVKTTLASLYALAKSQGIGLTDFMSMAYDAASDIDKKQHL